MSRRGEVVRCDECGDSVTARYAWREVIQWRRPKLTGGDECALTEITSRVKCDVCMTAERKGTKGQEALL